MGHTRAWRNFRRLEDGVTLFAALVFAGADLWLWRVRPAAPSFKLVHVVAGPVLFLALAVFFPLYIPSIRASLQGYVWRSFIAGFGQTPRSVLAGFSLPAAGAVLVLAQIMSFEHGGQYPAAVFAAYAAGVGILLAQSILVRELERDPTIRPQIEA